MKKNKKGLKLTGSKKFMNVPIDIFLKESKLYKEQILNELKNKNKKSKITTDKIFLTPLPDKPRVLLNTEKEKNDFLFAERQAVVMRTFEYTNALRNKGLSQYYQMKENEKQEMIYIMKKASNIIQNWWNSIKEKIRLEKIFKVKSINLCNLLKNFMKKKKKNYFKEILEKDLSSYYNKLNSSRENRISSNNLINNEIDININNKKINFSNIKFTNPLINKFINKNKFKKFKINKILKLNQ